MISNPFVSCNLTEKNPLPKMQLKPQKGFFHYTRVVVVPPIFYYIAVIVKEGLLSKKPCLYSLKARFFR
jgi:hypothetical protein